MKKLLIFVLTCLISSAGWAESVRVAAAISLKDALEQVAAQYKSQTGTDVEFTFGSSGQLATQIQNGAPVDLFISAANKQVDDLIKADVVEPSSRRVVAMNKLVLIVPAGATNAPDSLKALTEPAVTGIAIGEPKTVPAGQYAMQALQHAGVADAVKARLILGANVRQVLNYVERGEVSAGLVYATDAKLSGGKVRVTAMIDPGSHEPIVYPAVIVKASQSQAQASAFIEYIASEKAQAVLQEFGFASPPTEPAAKSSK